MRAVDIIVKKRDGEQLKPEEIDYLINNYVLDIIPDYQMAAYCMAVYFKGMYPEETARLTMAMAQSGDEVDLSSIPGIKIDKHSTGGVADTTTLVLGPLAASAGVPVAKMSGRGLGHTGGTIDKLESIPGFNTTVAREVFIKQVRDIGIAVMGQSGNMVPADKKLYALRDVTGTIESIPLIAGSIMSKKIAAGADAIILDVKIGTGAFMKNEDDAFELARTMVEIGQMTGRETVAVISDMNEPLGLAIGNSLEVEEAIQTLRGEKRGKLRELSLVLGSHMLKLADENINPSEGYKELEKLLDSGAALEKFRQMIIAQGGNPRVLEDMELLPRARHEKTLYSSKSGYLVVENVQNLGVAAMILGAGRETKESVIDLAVGIKLHCRTGERIEYNQALATFYYNEEAKLEKSWKVVEKSLHIAQYPVNPNILVHGVVTKEGIRKTPL